MKEQGFETKSEVHELQTITGKKVEPRPASLSDYHKKIFTPHSLKLLFLDEDGIKWNISLTQNSLDFPEQTTIECSHDSMEDSFCSTTILTLWDLVDRAEKIAAEIIEKTKLQQARLKMQLRYQLEKKREKVSQEMKHLENYILEKIQETDFIYLKKEIIKANAENFHLDIDFEKSEPENEQNRDLFRLGISMDSTNNKIEVLFIKRAEEGDYNLYRKAFSNLENIKSNLKEVFLSINKWC